VLAIGEFVVFHRFEKLHVFFDAAIAVGAVHAGLFQRTAIGAHVVGILTVYIGFALFDEVDGVGVELVEVIRRKRVAVPVETQPFDIAPYRVDVFDAFLLRVGVVEAQVAVTVIVARDSEISHSAPAGSG